ncbi:MAG: cadherin-like domain-containing protein [Oscillospiraceae bacterium]|nr:cadherin-like domain-containing protein [Oscillospiraceae bacterium]
MFRKRFVCLLAVLACLLSISSAATALEVDCDATYCFKSEDFGGEEPLVGICITELPAANTGTVMLGARVLRPGDILTAEQLAQMTFAPVRTEVDVDAVVTYLPIYENRVAKSTTMTIAVRGKEDKAPVAEDFAVETYKNLPNEGVLKVTDPEGQKLRYTVTRQPRRGEVVLRDDGSFLYTPKKNKVGVDSFTYTATDPAGNVSREATVTVQILKPSDSAQYTDTVGLDCRFEAEWLRNTGLFVGEKVGGQECFYPEKTVSKGEFLAMVLKALDVPVENQAVYTGMAKDAPNWLKPYLAAAVRSGLLAGWPAESETFAADAPITGSEAAVILHNALDLSGTADVIRTDSEQVPTWADTAVAVMNENGFPFTADAAMNRGQVAQVLYQVSLIADDAPGMAVFRLQQ